MNRNGAQLIFNTHAVTLLDLDVFRRDQIYFVEKDNKTGKSELFALSDFSPRKTEKVQKGYLQGRYGALPEIGLTGGYYMVRRAAKRSHDGKKRREKKLIVVAAEGENKTELTYLKEFNRTSIDVFKVTNQET